MSNKFVDDKMTRQKINRYVFDFLRKKQKRFHLTDMLYFCIDMI